MVSGLQVALAAEGLLSLALGAVVAWRGLDRAVSVVLGIWFGVWSVLMFLAVPYLPFQDAAPSWVWNLRMLFQAGLVSLTFAFFAVYPAGRPMRQKRWILRLALLPVLVAGIGAMVNYYPVYHESLLAFVYFLITGLWSPIGNFGPAILFLAQAYRAPDGPRRAQLAGAGSALMIWVINDGLVSLVNIWGYGAALFDLNVYRQVASLLHVVGMAMALALVVMVVLQSATGRRGWQTGATVGAWTVLAFLLSQLQELAPAGAAVVVHLAVDMATFLILFYLVARSQLLDVALARPSFTTRGLAVAIGLTAVIATQVMLEQVVGSAFGWFGAVLAGVSVAATIPLQQRLERVRAGHAAFGGQYEAFRRMRIYHAAVEGALQDGRLDGGDNQSLANLRRELGVGLEDHSKLVADLTTRI